MWNTTLCSRCHNEVGLRLDSDQLRLFIRWLHRKLINKEKFERRENNIEGEIQLPRGGNMRFTNEVKEDLKLLGLKEDDAEDRFRRA